MKRFTFCLIVLLLLFNNIVQSKNYLVEVEDEKGGSNQENPASVEDVNGEDDEDFKEDNARIESEGKTRLDSAMTSSGSDSIDLI